MQQYSLKQLAHYIDSPFHGDGNVVVESIAPLAKAQSHQLSFITNVKLRTQLSSTQAGILLVTENDIAYCQDGANLIVCNDPYVAYAKIAQYMDTTPKAAKNIATSAVISDKAKLGNNVSVGANAVIEAGVELGDDVIIGAGCFVGKNVKIGKGTQLWANVSIYHEVQIGDFCLIQSSAVIGSEGFGYANEKGQWVKIPQTGRVLIGNRVEIGACTCID